MVRSVIASSASALHYAQPCPPIACCGRRLPCSLWGALCLAAAFYGNWRGWERGRLLRRWWRSRSCWRAKSGSPRRQFREALDARDAARRAACCWRCGRSAPTSCMRSARAALHGGASGSRRVTRSRRWRWPLRRSGHKPGAWQDYAAMLAIALPIKLGWLHVTVSLPWRSDLVYVLTMLLAINVALAAFFFVRRIDGIGYSVGWRADWVVAFGALRWRQSRRSTFRWGSRSTSFASSRGAAHWRVIAARSAGDFCLHGGGRRSFCFVACCKTCWAKPCARESRDGSWRRSSLGFRTFDNGVFPTGGTCCWRRLRDSFMGLPGGEPASIFPGAMVHTLVDAMWLLLFRTL